MFRRAGLRGTCGGQRRCSQQFRWCWRWWHTGGLCRIVAWLEMALLISSLLYILLDVFRGRLTSLQLRIAADAALLTPLLFLPWMR